MPRQSKINDYVKTRWLAEATYSVTPSTLTMAAENSTVTFNVSTVKVPNGTTLYWTILDVTTTSADFVASSGSFVITASGGLGTGSFTVTGVLDELSESTETFRVQIRTTSVSGTVRATTSSISIPNATYTLTSSPAGTSFNEGTTIYVDVETTKVEPGTTLYWSINNITTAAADFDVTSGSFSIGGDTEFGIGSFSFSILEDLSTEGSQTFTVSVRKTSISGTALVTTPTWTIIDTSVDGPNTRLYGWGQGLFYQLGNNNTSDQPTPILMTIGQLPIDPPYLKVATGLTHTMVIKADGTLWGVGQNTYGQLGDGSTTTRTSFVRVGTASQQTWTWSDVVCGEQFTVGIRATPSVALYAWGYNSDGQLGASIAPGNSTFRTSPVACVLGGGLSPVTTGPWDKLFAGNASWVVRYQGNNQRWGWAGAYYNSENGLGSGISNRFSTVVVFAPTWNNPQNNIVSAINVTDWCIGSNFGMVLMADGRITCSGRNFAGQFGNGNTTQWFEFRSLTTSGSGSWSKISVSPNSQSVLAVRNDGSLWSWGAGNRGQLGIGTTINRSVPVSVGLNVSSIQSGGTYSFARDTGGLLYAWGMNASGQLGTGYAGADELTPTATYIWYSGAEDISYTTGLFRLGRNSYTGVMISPNSL